MISSWSQYLTLGYIIASPHPREIAILYRTLNSIVDQQCLMAYVQM